MADANFGHVGTLPGRVDLYYGKKVQWSIPIEEAVAARINLIKEDDMWKNPEEIETEKPKAAVTVA